jgi:DNA invertase Pin-like site-specific DNA recombinase
MRLSFSYTRFSDPRQGKGRSAQRQMGRAERWSRRNKLSLDLSLDLADEGLSGYWGDHTMKGALGRFLALCGTERVPAGSVLIVEDFDRLSRQVPDDAWELFRQILLTGVEIAVLTLGKWFTKASLNSFEDRILVQASQHRAHEESRLKAGRLRDVWKARRRRAKAGRPTYTKVPGWCVKGRGRRKPELHPGRAATVLEMVRLAREGWGVQRIAAELAAQPEQYPCWRKSGAWSGGAVYLILTSNALWGAYQPRCYGEGRKVIPAGEVIRDYYPALLSEDEARAIRLALRGRRRERGRRPAPDRSALRRLVWDAQTGAQLFLHGTKGRPSGKIVHLYLERNHAGARKLMVRYGAIEALVLRVVQQWAPGALRAPVPGGDDQAKKLDAVLLEIAEAKAAVKEQLSRRCKGSAVAALAAALDDLDAREEEVRGELEGLRRGAGGVPAGTLAEAQALAVQVAGAPAAEQPQLRRRLNARLREVIEGVWLYRQDLGPHKAAVYVQVWPRAGEAAYSVYLVGKPPAGWEPLPLAPGLVDFRGGYPSPLAPAGGGRYRGTQPAPIAAQAASASE